MLVKTIFFQTILINYEISSKLSNKSMLILELNKNLKMILLNQILSVLKFVVNFILIILIIFLYKNNYLSNYII
jgi:hypothetical protein